MSDRATATLVLDAETAEPVESARWTARAGRLEVEAPGYLTKVYDAGTLPQIVRLLAAAPYVFAASPSTRPGENLVVHYSAPSGAMLRLRCAHRSVVFQLAELPPATGTVPDHDLVSVGLDWPATIVHVPEDATSGVWVLELESGQATAAAPLVVRCSRSQPRPAVVVTASTATWLCYNHWGGRNRYRNAESGPKLGSSRRTARELVAKLLAVSIPEVPRTKLKQRLGVDMRESSWISAPLSWRRPWRVNLDLQAPVSTPILNHLAGLDARILAWLDREGIAYECVADLDLHSDPGVCDDRAAVVLAGHSEYWSTEMLEQLLTAHRRNGTWVLNLSGNSMYRRITVQDDNTVALADLVMALSGRDESELTGVRFSERAYGTASPYVVTRPDHWVFRGVQVKRGDRFGGDCLIANVAPRSAESYDPARPTTPDTMLRGQGAAGFEVDRRLRRWRRTFQIVAQGAARRSAHMVVKEPHGETGGALSASSISFGGSLLLDQTCSRVVLNVLNRALSGE